MNILVITPYYKPAYIYGGPARSIPALCEGLVKCGASITVYTTNANGPGKTLGVAANVPINIDGVTVYYFPIFWPLAYIYPFYSPMLGKAGNSLTSRYDIIYIAGNWTYPGLVGANFGRRTRTPYIISPRGSFMEWSMGEKWMKKRFYLALFERRIVNNASAIHVTSLLEKTQLQKWNFAPPVHVIPNGIDLSPFESLSNRGTLRELLGIQKEGTVSLFVGRLHKEKRLELIIESFAQFSDKLPHSHLLIVGADQDGTAARAKEIVLRHSLSKQVHFLGPLISDELIQAYVDADLLVLLSHRENFGMVVLEAMAVGLPVLLTKEVGLAQEVEQAKSGKVVNANQAEAGKIWQELLVKQDIRESMGRKGAELVRERFEASIVASRMIELFRLTLAQTEQD